MPGGGIQTVGSPSIHYKRLNLFQDFLDNLDSRLSNFAISMFRSAI